MEIRHARPADAPAIQDSARTAWETAYDDILPQETIDAVIADWYAVDSLRDEVDDPAFFVAAADGGIVGFVHATVDDDTATLHRLYVDPPYWRGGIGSALYERVEDAVQADVDCIELEVLTANSIGQSFYRKQGFTRKRTEEITLGGETVTQHVMAKQL